MDEALGELNCERAVRFGEHLAQCAACRQRVDNAKAISTAVDRGVGMLVAGEPSPQFTASLRARIANEYRPPRLEWLGWIPVAVGALTLAALLVAAMIGTRRLGTRGSVRVAQGLSSPATEVHATTERGVANGRQTLRRAKYHTVPTQQLEVLVPRGQLAAVMQFANAMNEGHVDGEQIVKAQEQSEQPIEIEPIQISPLRILELDNPSGTPGTSGGF